jgi:hypothetical protein
LKQLFDKDIRIFALELRSIILHIIGFGVINIVGLDLSKTKIGNIVFEITHNGFDIKAQVWMKVHDGNRAWKYCSILENNLFLPLVLFRS